MVNFIYFILNGPLLLEHWVLSSVPNLYPNSDPNGFLQLRRTDITRTNGENPVVARSYNGYQWEGVPDEDLPTINLDCTSWPGSCAVLDAGTYTLESIAVPSELLNTEADARWSRLMMQATFGTSKSGLDSVAATYGNDQQQWVLDQMALPVTSHRDHYRKRVNPRRQAASKIGSFFTPCEPGARYHRHVFNKLDEGRALLVHNNGAGQPLTIRIDGDLRGEVPDWLGILPSNTTVSWPLTYTICTVIETINGTVELDTGDDLCAVDVMNMPIDFQSPSSNNTKVLSTSQAYFVPVSNMPGAIVLRTISVSCNGIPSANSDVRYDGEYYRFDPRVKLIENTVENPSQSQEENAHTCPAVVKTFLNEQGCVRAPSCLR